MADALLGILNFWYSYELEAYDRYWDAIRSSISQLDTARAFRDVVDVETIAKYLFYNLQLK